MYRYLEEKRNLGASTHLHQFVIRHSLRLVGLESFEKEWCAKSQSDIFFEKLIGVTIEDGHANRRSDDFHSVGYWYQTGPNAGFPKLPAAEDD